MHLAIVSLVLARLLSLCPLSSAAVAASDDDDDEEGDGGNVNLPTRCEQCALTVLGLVAERSRQHKPGEADFLEATEVVCKRIGQYKVHRHLTGVARFQPHESAGMRELQKLVDRGVQVVADVPPEMWHRPSVEVARLQLACETLLADHDETLLHWWTLPDWSNQTRALRELQDLICIRTGFVSFQQRHCLDEDAALRVPSSGTPAPHTNEL